MFFILNYHFLLIIFAAKRGKYTKKLVE